jgi:hypothetical protein
MVRWLMLLFLLCCASSSVRGEANDDRYFLPLLGKYGIYRADPGFDPDDRGTHQLVERISQRQAGFSSNTIVKQVKQFAVHQKWIVGTTEAGFFIFDADPANDWAEAETFNTIEDWHRAMERAGIPPNLTMLDPDQEAAKVSDQTLRPWNYRMVGGALGWSDDFWSLVVQTAGFAISVLIGLLAPRELRLLVPAVAMGLAIDVIGMIVIAGGGPGACVGLVAFPLYCWLAMGIGRLFRRGIGAARRRFSSHTTVETP